MFIPIMAIRPGTTYCTYLLPAAQRLPDRAAEDVHEQQGEDDRQQQGVEHRLRVLLDLQQVAADQGADVPQVGRAAPIRPSSARWPSRDVDRGRAHTATSSRVVGAVAASCGALGAFWPVMARNTSSRLGSSVAMRGDRDAAGGRAAPIDGGQLLVAERSAPARPAFGVHGGAGEPGRGRARRARRPAVAAAAGSAGRIRSVAAADLGLQLLDAAARR